MSRTKGAKGKKNQEPKLSEENKKKVEQGLQEAKEGKLIPQEELIKEGLLQNPLVEQNNKQISQERKDKLNTVLRDINKNVPDSVKYANTIEERARLSFGYKCLDRLTNGGIMMGSYTTLWGSKGVGKSTIAYKLIATTQKQGKIAVYIDMERSYDPVWAKSFGVDTENLIYIQTKEAEETLDVVIKLCREKVADLIVLDSLHGMSPHGEQYTGKADKERSLVDDTMALLARKLSQFFRMATPVVSDAKCAILLIGQSRLDLGSFIKCEVLSGGHALAHNSRLILRLRRGQKADGEFNKVPTGKLTEKGKPEIELIQTGFSLVVRVEKSQVKGCTEGNEIATIFNYKEGIRDE
jgi:RecA/RadA recombinase